MYGKLTIYLALNFKEEDVRRQRRPEVQLISFLDVTAEDAADHARDFAKANPHIDPGEMRAEFTVKERISIR